MNIYQFDQSQEDAFYDGLIFNQHTLTAYSTQWAFPMPMNYSQGSTSPADVNDGPHNLATAPQGSYPRASIGYPDATISHSADVRVQSLPFTQPSPSAKPAPEESSLDIILVDPTHPHTHCERRVRSREDLAKQKQDSLLLKTSGGACIWCYRSKKKCNPTRICQPCGSNGRKCIREPAQLSLLGSVAVSPNDYSVITLGRLGLGVFQKAERFNVAVNIRQPHGGSLHTFAMDLTSADLALPKTTKVVIDQFMENAIKCVQCPRLLALEEAYSSHPLVQKALRMAKLFLSMASLAKTRVCVQPGDVEAARLTIFLILAAGSQSLTEMAQSYSVELYDALRRKDHQDSYCHGKYRPRTKDPLHPLWVACALYYRVVGGLLDLKANSPITRIFQSLEPHLDDVHSTLWGIILCVSPSPRQNNRKKTKHILRDQIPVLSSTRYFDVSLMTSIGDGGDGNPPPAMLSQEGNLFAEPGFDSESLLNNESTQPAPSLTNTSTSQDSLKPSSSTEPQVGRTGPSISGTLDSRSLLNNEPTQPVPFPIKTSTSQDTLNSSSSIEPQVERTMPERTLPDSMPVSGMLNSPAVDLDIYTDMFDPMERNRWNFIDLFESVYDGELNSSVCFVNDTL